MPPLYHGPMDASRPSPEMATEQAIELVEMRRLARSGGARARRQQAGLSLAEVGRAVGASAAAVSRWENGQRRPTGGAALAYARLLRRIGDDGVHAA